VETQINFEQAERRFRELQALREEGGLDANTFHVEVAKLLVRDEQGVFWMPDADSGTWFCNRGEGWAPGDPYAEPPPETDQVGGLQARRRRMRRLAVAGAALSALLAITGALAWWQSPAHVGDRSLPATIQTLVVAVTIASPADGSQVVLGQEVSIESTLAATPDLQAVARVDLQVDGQTVNTQSVRSQIQAGQTSFPLSLLWRPRTGGEHAVAVTALSGDGSLLGVATITLYVTEASAGTLPELACVPDATFVADVTIPPGATFPPGARMDKAWQVRNKGSCAWGVGYELVLVAGESLGAPGAVPVPPTDAGQPADLSVTFWAPSEVGAYASVWQLQSPGGVFFGPTLTLQIQVEVLARESLPPAAPADLQATVAENGRAVRLTWEDRSDNEDAFRIYREDVEASIGLAPANANLFVDEGVACGHTYRYAIAAFNAAGAAPSGTAEVVLPPCAPADTPLPALPTPTTEPASPVP
jgi:Ig-like domain from next to BRCA1 gene/Bacterial Ig domain